MFTKTFTGIVNVNRGDSFVLSVQLNVGTNMFPKIFPVDECTYIYLGIMEPNQPFETALIKKKCTQKDVDINGFVHFRFSPRDTECVLPGKYYYQVKIQQFHDKSLTDYEVTTIVGSTQFYVME